jgi:hypothetical protein
MKKQEGETKKKSKLKKERSVRGVVTSRKCESCGHHEIGIITENGDYLSLKPGMRVEVIGAINGRATATN